MNIEHTYYDETTDLSGIIPVGFEPAVFAEMLERWLNMEKPALVRSLVEQVEDGVPIAVIPIPKGKHRTVPHLRYRTYFPHSSVDQLGGDPNPPRVTRHRMEHLEDVPERRFEDPEKRSF